MHKINRRRTHNVSVGLVNIGSSHPIVIQSMTNTKTSNVVKTTQQVKELTLAGSDLVRLTINDEKSMQAIVPIHEQLRKDGYLVGLIGDFHFNGHVLLEKYPESAKILSKYRINPGNVGRKNTYDKNFTSIIESAIRYKKPVRIGVNSGSLDPDILAEYRSEKNHSKKTNNQTNFFCHAMVASALRSAHLAEKIGLAHNKIVLSVKMSQVNDMITAYELLAKSCKYPLHLGLTEAGSGSKGVISSTAGLSILLHKGIGDTIRVSLTPSKVCPRVQEVQICKIILQALGLRYFRPEVISCPGCGRTANHFFETLASEINEYIEERLPNWKKNFKGIEHLKIAVMGCVVNGPGESKQAHIGISLPGLRENPCPLVYTNGKLYKILKPKNIKKQFIHILEKYIRQKYC